MPRHHRLALAACTTAFLSLAPLSVIATGAFNPPDTPGRDIHWSTCDSRPRLASFAVELGDRLRCGTLRVPLDHHRPADGSLTISVVRVAAAEPSRRIGTLFVNPGGPGGDAGAFAAHLAAIWNRAVPDDPVHGEKKRLGEEYDIVAVVPRGMPGSAPLHCVIELPPGVRSILVDRSERNVAAWDLAQRRYAQACQDDPRFPYISTEQTVYDHEVVRRSLGEPTFNFLGLSYGTWLGAWYGATYPQRVGRMVFDSVMDFTVPINDNYLLSAPAMQEAFDRNVARPAAAAPRRYGLGSDETTVRAVLRTLVPDVRDAFTTRLGVPEDLMAARTLSDWLRAEPALARDDLRTRIQGHRFHYDDDLHRRIRSAALGALDEIYLPLTPPGSVLSSATAMGVAITCNDTPESQSAGSWLRTLASYAQLYPAGHSGDLMNACIYARGPNAVKPPIERLARAGRILMVTGEHDTLTPVGGALRMLNALPNAKMLVLRESARHAAFTLTDEPCIERTTARFLLDGRAPTSQLTECQVDPHTPVVTGSFTEAEQVQAWRDQVARIVGVRAARVMLQPMPRAAAEDAR